MKMKAKGVMIEEKIHLLFSPQWGTDCGIRKHIEPENLLEITNINQITCQDCLTRLYNNMAILRGSYGKE